ncbi:ankyrin repeat domain-containing protein [bacterium]|jgi:ankyrin repeat protein|nr:ankyrin repeat domain-containing protein [bacterium]
MTFKIIAISTSNILPDFSRMEKKEDTEPTRIFRIKKKEPVEISGYTLVRLTIETDNVFNLCEKDETFSFSKTNVNTFEFEMTVPIPEECNYKAEDIEKLAKKSFKWALSYGFDEKKSKIGIIAAGLSAFCYPDFRTTPQGEKVDDEYPKELEFLNRYLSFLYFIDDRVDVLIIEIQDIEDDVKEKTTVFDRFINELTTKEDIDHDQFNETKKTDAVDKIKKTVALYKKWTKETYSNEENNEDKETLRKNLGSLIYGNEEICDYEYDDFSDDMMMGYESSSPSLPSMSYQNVYSTEHAEQLCMLELLSELLTLSPTMTPSLLKDWRNSFVEYIENIIKEKRHENGDITLNDAEQANVRKYVSGALHVLELFAAFKGINLKKMEKVFPQLEAMKHTVAEHVGEINDCPLSTYKELKDSIKELKKKNKVDAENGIVNPTQNLSNLSLIRHVLAQPKISILDRKIKEEILGQIETLNAPEELSSYFFHMIDKGKIPYVGAKISNRIDGIYKELLSKFDGYVSVFYQARCVLEFQLDAFKNNDMESVKEAYKIGLQFLTSTTNTSKTNHPFQSLDFLDNVDAEKTRKDINDLIIVYEAWLTHPLASLKIPRYNVHLKFDEKDPDFIFKYAKSFVDFAKEVREAAHKNTPQTVPSLEKLADLPNVYFRTEPYSETQVAVKERNFEQLTKLNQSNSLYDDEEWGDDALLIAMKNNDATMINFLLEELHFNWLWKNKEYFSSEDLENRPETVFSMTSGIYNSESLIGNILKYELTRVEETLFSYIRSEFVKPSPQLPDKFFCDIRQHVPLAFREGNTSYVYKSMMHFPPIACLDSLDVSEDNRNSARNYDRYFLQESFIDAVKDNNSDAMQYLHAIGDIIAMSVEDSIETFNEIMDKKWGGPSNKEWTHRLIATELFLNPDLEITQDCYKQVIYLSDYLSVTNQELRGVPTGDNAFCDALIGSFKQLTKDPNFKLEEHESLLELNEALQNGTIHDFSNLKLETLPDNIHEYVYEGYDEERIKEIKKANIFQSTNNKVHSLAQTLNFPIRITRINLDDASENPPEHFDIRDTSDESEVNVIQCQIGLFDQISMENEESYFEQNDIGIYANRPEIYLHIIEIDGHYLYSGPKSTTTEFDVESYKSKKEGLNFQDIKKQYIKYYKKEAPENIQEFSHKLKLIQLLSFYAQHHQANYSKLRQLITEKMKNRKNDDMYLAFYRKTILNNQVYDWMDQNNRKHDWMKRSDYQAELLKSFKNVDSLCDKRLDNYQTLNGQRLANQYHRNFVDYKTPLHYAVATGSIATINTLSELGASIYALDHEDHTPFSRACLNRNRDAALKLLPTIPSDDEGESDMCPTDSHFFQIIDRRGNTALHYGCLSGTMDVVKKCLQDKAVNKMKVQPSYTDNPIDSEIRRLQKEFGVVPQDLNQINRHGKSPLHMAASTKSIDVFCSHSTLLKYLLEAAPHEDPESSKYVFHRPSITYLSSKNSTESLFDCAVYAGNEESINYLWDKRYDDIDSDLDYHKLLLKPKEDADDPEVSGIFIRAITSHSPETLRLVLDKYVDCFKEICDQKISDNQKIKEMQKLDIGEVLYRALYDGGLEIIDIVLRWKAAILPRCPHLVARILNNELSTNKPAGKKEPLIFKAVSGGFLDVVQFLIQNESKLNTIFRGKDLVTHALKSGYPEIADYLRDIPSSEGKESLER